MIEDRLLVIRRECPAGRIVGRVDVDRARAGCQRSEQAVDVERPSVATECQFDAVDIGAEDLRDLDQVRPKRRDGDDAVPGTDQSLRGQHQCRHPGIGNRNPVRARWLAQARYVGGDPFAQLGNA